MAFQSINIIGSLTAGPSFVQNQMQSDRDRADAYRALLRAQGSYRHPAEKNDDAPVGDIDTEDRMSITDSPEDGSSPHFLKKRSTKEKKRSDNGSDETEPEVEAGDHLDTIV